MIRYFKIGANGLVESNRDDSKVVVVVAPDDKERELIQKQFHLDDYDLASTLDPDEVPRLEVSDGRSLFIWKIPERAVISEAIDLAVNVVGLSIAQDRLVFLMNKGDISFNEREFRNLTDIRDVMLAFLLRSIRHFVSHLRIIKQMSSELEKKITISMENRHLLQMFSLSESLIYYIDAIEGNEAALMKLRSIASQLGFQDRHLSLLDDIILENGQASRQGRIYSLVLSGLMDARGTIVNNNMNVLLKNLTLISIVFLPLNLIASIGGMSEYSMMTQGISWQLSYSLFGLGMVVLGWCTWVFVRKVLDRGSVRADNKNE